MAETVDKGAERNEERASNIPCKAAKRHFNLQMQTKLWQRPNVCNKVHNGAVQELACDGKMGKWRDGGGKLGGKAARSSTYVRASAEFLLLFCDSLYVDTARKGLYIIVRDIISFIEIGTSKVYKDLSGKNQTYISS